jgi:plasmid stabilization system protein ParE
MEVRWSPEAGNDFVRIIEYIRAQNPDAALRMARNIYRTVATLKHHPRRGRAGRVNGTRELVLAPLRMSSSTVFSRTQSRWPEFCTAHNAGRKWPAASATLPPRSTMPP